MVILHPDLLPANVAIVRCFQAVFKGKDLLIHKNVALSASGTFLFQQACHEQWGSSVVLHWGAFLQNYLSF